MNEFKTLGELMVEDAIRSERNRRIRNFILVVCAVASTVALVILAVKK